MRKFLLALVIFLAIPTIVLAAEESKPAEKEAPRNFMSLIEGIKFKENSFGDVVRDDTATFLKKVEAWRQKTIPHLETSIEIVKKSRKESADAKSALKAMSFLHLAGLEVAKFIFSIGMIFYALAVVLTIVIIKNIFRLIGRLFRRRSVEA